MNKTIEYYNRNAETFVSGTVNADMTVTRDRFLAYLPTGGRILDAGCGSGRDTKAFMDKGYVVDAFDASEELCKMASEYAGLDVKCMCFEDLSGEDLYDGIWACASLLHVKKIDLPKVMHRLYKLLKPNGILYASFKYGDSERISNGRFFSDMTEGPLSKLISSAGMDVIEMFVSDDVRTDRSSEKWINIIAKKQSNCGPSDKTHQLFLRQKDLLDTFLEHHAITKAQYDKSLGDLVEKMGEKEGQV